MSTQTRATEIPIGDYDWLVLKEIGDDYFVCATSPLFKGYYSLDMCPFPESKLYKFLNSRFAEQMRESGIDTDHIRNIGILSSGQYNLYIYDRLPSSPVPYLLQTPYPDNPGCVTAVDNKGKLIPYSITDQCGIRPSFFVSKEYVRELTGISAVVSLADVKTYTEIEEEETKRLAVIKTENDKEAERDADAAQLLITAEEERLAAIEAEEAAKHAPAAEDVESVVMTNAGDIIIISDGTDEITEPAEAEEAAEASQEAPEAAQTDETEEVEEALASDETAATAPLNEAQSVTQDVSQSEKTDEMQSPDAREAEAAEAQEHEAAIEEPKEIAESAEQIEAVATAPDATIGMTTEENGSERFLIKDEGRGVHSVYWYGEDYKNYAILITEGDERVMSVMERRGLAIRAFLLSSSNENRKPIDRNEVMGRFHSMQSRWSWQKQGTKKR